VELHNVCYEYDGRKALGLDVGPADDLPIALQAGMSAMQQEWWRRQNIEGHPDGLVSLGTSHLLKDVTIHNVDR
jgi:hypothetical protein